MGRFSRSSSLNDEFDDAIPRAVVQQIYAKLWAIQPK